jgi:hypothetical protein
MRAAVALLAIVWAGALRADPAVSVEEARARQLAGVLRLEPHLERLMQATPPGSLETTLAQLTAVEHAIVALSRAALTLDATLARLEHEELAAKSAHDLLEARHQDSVTRLNIAAIIVGNGVTIVGAGLELGNDTVAKWGNGVTCVGAAVAATFSIVALAKRDVGALPLAIETNMLASLLGRTPTARSGYADWIWRYLDTPLAGATSSIRGQLLDKWRREGRLPRAGGRPDERRLALLAEPLSVARRLDAVVLDDRADMLADVRERLAGLSVDLELLWREVQAHR